jgi:hypothetical protein
METTGHLHDISVLSPGEVPRYHLGKARCYPLVGSVGALESRVGSDMAGICVLPRNLTLVLLPMGVGMSYSV